MQLSAQEIAQILGGTIEGDAAATVTHPGKIEDGDAGSITFLGNAKYESYLYTTAASVVIIDQHYQLKQPVAPTLVRVPDVYAAVAALLAMFGAPKERARSISPQAAVDESAVLGQDVGIGRFTVVEAGAHIGAGSLLYDQVYVGAGAKIGRGVVLYPGVRVMERCVIGDHCVLHPNVVIGGDGFGFAPQPDGSYQKIAHAGNAVLEANVEVGAGTTIDRASIGSTIIREGVKLDNLVQIAHNVEIGAHTVIAAQAGVAGSTKIGSHCRIGGQVGFAGHLHIADGTEIQAQSGIASHVKTPKTQLFGSPAIPYRDYVRAYAVFKQLPELYKQLHRLEQELKAYRQGGDAQ